MIDLHSDTVTTPTYEMRHAMMNAEVGDDVSNEDPTVHILEARIASMFGKEAALFFPSGTMSNLVAAMVWCYERGSEMIVGDKSHMFLYEQAGAAQFGGISSRTVPNLEDGTMSIRLIEGAIRDADIHEPSTKLICIENTHNACGGKILPVEFLEELLQLSNTHNIPIHMDGARIWNALTASRRQPHEIAKHVHSLSVCLSKGLGCPIGSLLVGTTEFIEKARRIRKGLGGGMRQVGIVAAAGLVGLDDFEKGVLQGDHEKASRLAEAIGNMPAFELMTPINDTNIVFVHVLLGTAHDLGERMLENGVIVSIWSPTLIRLVIHRNISDADIDCTIRALQQVSNMLIQV